MAEQHSEQTYSFQTEARQLLHLMVHALYSNREIFLRELISNAADAIDKLRFRALAAPELVGEDTDYAITIAVDGDAGTLSIADNGIGMTREEVVENLGTIAKSGTAEFLANLTGDQKRDASLIGQFGVGFYSAFIVADRVEVFTRGAGTGAGTVWRSAGEDSFSVEDAADLPRGTRVVLHLKADARDFADDFRVRAVVRKYSDHIGVPVRMAAPKGDGDGEDEADTELETVNSARALWTRSRSEITDDEYREFYKHVSHDFEDPLRWSHNRVEGKLEYTSLLYLPRRAPFDLWNRDAPRGLKLYVQRVFIMDQAEQFLPLYLRFVRGVVDCNDLPLNVSREILQQDDRVTTIKNALCKRVLSMLEKLSGEPDDYQMFWNEFGEVLKEGVGEDFGNRETLAGLLRFHSTAHADGDQNVSLDVYRERMVEGQDTIYYLVADSLANARNSPHLEVFKDRGVEVLLLHDRIDEWLMASLTEYAGKSFQDVMRGDLELPGEGDTAAGAQSQPEDDRLAERIKAALGDRVDEVRRSKRLTGSPACLVLNQDALGAQMRRIMEAAGQTAPETRPHFEFNGAHPLLEVMDAETDENRFRDLALVLFDQASLAEGSALQDASGYVNRINALLLRLLRV